MRNKNIIMLLMSSLILSGCGPQPENKESQQQLILPSNSGHAAK